MRRWSMLRITIRTRADLPFIRPTTATLQVKSSCKMSHYSRFKRVKWQSNHGSHWFHHYNKYKDDIRFVWESLLYDKLQAMAKMKIRTDVHLLKNAKMPRPRSTRCSQSCPIVPDRRDLPDGTSAESCFPASLNQISGVVRWAT